ncbi:chaperone binding protein, putative [Ricinus communis]|uniref:Chaperone binding protein, putative n=1 Tax=Ricinus communis TaxID=3988 RepID=B9RTA1_RICCO|nr:chaperone binding protein, putative [Ricinus communis]|eukprot:XP_002516970.1 keratin, type I cytoskeletal 9 [Ricinus communis]
MNSNYGKGTSGSLNNFNFDFGIGSNRSKSLNDQKNQTSSSYSSYSSSTTTQSKPAWQSNKPSWTHQPAPSQSTRPGLNGPSSMVGDISGKSWNSMGVGSGSGLGIVEKSPNLFGDLVSSALGQGTKGKSDVPLKNVTPTSSNSAYSMGNMADSLPKTGNSVKSGGSWGFNDNIGSYKSSSNVNVNASGNANISSNKSSNLGGPSMTNMMSGSGVGGGMGGGRDPFGSLVDFGSKQQAGGLNSASKSSVKTSSGGKDGFGDFQNATGSSATAFPSGNFAASNNGFTGSGNTFNSDVNDFGFGMPNKDSAPQKQTSVQTASGDPLEMLFSSSAGGAASASGGAGGQQFSEVDDWGLDSGFGGGAGDDLGGATTTELEGLPPPPAGFTASAAKNKGIDNQKQGQYADAIKWLSWAVVLFEKTGDKASTMEVLSSRASCYKEVGEYKKAVADCTKVLEEDDANVSVLVQRALLYESMEKYKLGAEDLRTVLKIDPTNRIAKSTVHRLTKMID